MPGIVSAKTTPPRLSLPSFEATQIRTPTPDKPESSNPKLTSPVVPRRTPSPSPSTSRAKPSPDRSSGKKKPSPDTASSKSASNNIDDSALDNPDLGPFLLKLARDAIASGDGPNKALDYAIRASKSFERRVAASAADGSEQPSLDLAMSLHVLAAIYCSLGRLDEAIPVLERAIRVPDVSKGPDHALAAFSGYMQLGDTHSMIGQLDRSIGCYKEGLKIQIDALGETDPRVAETCRYLAEAHVQAMQFGEAENLCKQTLEIHRVHSAPASLEEAADRRLMALICEAKGDYESALEHLVLASMVMIANGQDNEVAAIDVGIGNIYQSLCRFDEAVFSYQKALTVFKSSKGENHPSVASVYIRLADLYYKTGKIRESKSYCENALRIYNKPVPGATQEDIACGLSEIAAVYESINESEEALKLLQRAMKLLEDKVGQQSTIAGMEARRGVMYYVVGNYADALGSFESAIAKLRASGERKSAFFGVLLNQMGLACVQLFKIDEAAELFEEARGILEQECGPCHQDTLGVYSNLAATYDALGRIDDSIEILEYVLKLREEKLGTANPDFDDEKKRLTELLKEVGRSRNRKAKSLENLIDPNSKRSKKEVTKRWGGLGLRR
ncbi:Protein KINESIN LIGHT CHAIN-RELATED 1 [Dionaea muscipula]